MRKGNFLWSILWSLPFEMRFRALVEKPYGLVSVGYDNLGRNLPTN